GRSQRDHARHAGILECAAADSTFSVGTRHDTGPLRRNGAHRCRPCRARRRPQRRRHCTHGRLRQPRKPPARIRRPPRRLAEGLSREIPHGIAWLTPAGLSLAAYCSAMHVDAMTIPQPLGRVGDLAQRTQSAGFSGLLFTETGRTAYLNAAVASQAAPGLELSTGVAVAFPRSPFVTAATAWELQEATGGNFRLGLGTQVRTHVVRRYGAAFERPCPRLRHYLLAVKACFCAFRSGTLDHHGEFYDLNFITPQWSAGPIDAPDPKVDIAAVNPWMLRMAGEVADG